MVSLILLPGTLALSLGDAVRPDEPKLDRRAALLEDDRGRGGFRVRTHMACLLAEPEPGIDRRDLPALARDLVAFARDTGRVPVVRGVRACDLVIWASVGLHPDRGQPRNPGATYTVRPRGVAGAWAALVARPRRMASPGTPPVRQPIRVPLRTSPR